MKDDYTMEESLQKDIQEMMKPRTDDDETSSSHSSHSSHSSKTSKTSTTSGSESEEGTESEEGSEYEIDLSDNEIYKALYSFFEDEEGHNILDYISLLHTELIGIGKTLTNVKVIRKDMTRIADSLEKLVAMKEVEMEERRRRHSKS
jgi:hypothetical protein